MLKKIAIACGIIGAGVIGYQIGKHLGNDEVKETADTDTEFDEGNDEAVGEKADSGKTRAIWDVIYPPIYNDF